MVTKYGMSEKLGPIAFGSGNGEVFLGKDYGRTRDYSESVAAEIDAEIERIINEAYARTEKILTEHRDKLEKVAQRLIAVEKIEGDEFMKIMTDDGYVPDDEAEQENSDTSDSLNEETVQAETDYDTVQAENTGDDSTAQ